MRGVYPAVPLASTVMTELSYLELVDQVARSQGAVERSVAALTEERARQPSLLPGWTRGHVVTHLARNADAHHRFAKAVVSGAPMTEMYPGGPEARAAGIEEGADRPVALLAGDVAFAGRRVIVALRAVTPDRYGTTVPWRRPGPASHLPVLRWRELEIHHVDLGVGYTPSDWPDAFVAHTLATELPALREAAPDVGPPELPDRELLAWLLGRPTRDGLPELPAWPF